MFDFALHLRFLQKATEAFFEMGQASVAASLACQSRIHDELTSGGHSHTTTPAFPAWPQAWPQQAPLVNLAAWNPGSPSPSFWSSAPAPVSRPSPAASSSPWQMWLDCWLPSAPEPVTPEPATWPTDPMAIWLAAANVWQTWASPEAFPRAGSAAASGLGAGIPGWPMFAATANFWGVSPWSFYQGPMMAMMLSYGVPYAVAAPTARASTSAMDAADCACTQWRLVFGSGNERALPEWPQATRRRRPAAQWPAYSL